MSTTGNWGNRIIITLTSDGERRNKKWCRYYENATNYCRLRHTRCIGSSQCDYYKGTTREAVPVFKPSSKKRLIPPNPPPAQKKEPRISIEELYRKINWGDKLLGEIVLIRNKAYSFRVAKVTNEDLHSFTVVYDNSPHRYIKEIVFKTGAYLLESCRSSTEE